jgi:hypothetical protein
MGKTFNRKINDVVEGWFYDDAVTAKVAVMSAASIQVGPYYSSSAEYYVVRYDNSYYISTIARSKGWHQVVYDFTGNNTVKLYIDGIFAAQIDNVDSYSWISLGDYWTNSLISNLYYDDISVYQ